jgi:apolipoprotein N-acyltransferase
LWEPDPITRGKIHDSALLIGPEGAVWGRYDKQVLMPFGEYMPLESTFPALKRFDPNEADYSPSNDQRTISWPDRFAIAPLICYDDLFASVARAGVRAGGLLLVALNNDAWYGDTAAVTEHDTLARWRAIETRRYFARCDNAGFTNIVDPLGRETGRLPAFHPGVLMGMVRPERIETVYTRWGDWFAYLNLAALAMLAVIRLNTRAKRSERRRKSGVRW